MAINKNHEFEELDGIKCAIVEKNASEERMQFLKDLLQQNQYTVVVVASPPPKATPAPPPKEGDAIPDPAPLPPSTFTIGVTDVTLNAINAVFGRLLKTKNGSVVTLAYWHQKETVANDEIPYFEKKIN